MPCQILQLHFLSDFKTMVEKNLAFGGQTFRSRTHIFMFVCYLPCQLRFLTDDIFEEKERQICVCREQHICVLYTFVKCTYSCGICRARLFSYVLIFEKTHAATSFAWLFDNLIFVFLQQFFFDNLKVDHPHQ